MMIDWEKRAYQVLGITSIVMGPGSNPRDRVLETRVQSVAAALKQAHEDGQALVKKDIRDYLDRADERQKIVALVEHLQTLLKEPQE